MIENEIYITEDRTQTPILYKGKVLIAGKEYVKEGTSEEFYKVMNALRSRINTENNYHFAKVDHPVHFEVKL